MKTSRASAGAIDVSTGSEFCPGLPLDITLIIKRVLDMQAAPRKLKDPLRRPWTVQWTVFALASANFDDL